MGIIKSGILGPMINKTGSVIGKIHKGQNVITGISKKLKRRKKKTESQITSRVRFGKLNSFLSDIKSLVTVGFKKMVKHNTAANAAYSYNFDHAFITVNGRLELNYPKLVYSIGDVEGPESPVLVTENGFLNISWFNMPQSINCQYSDLATVLVYEPIEPDNVFFTETCKRSDLNVILDVSHFIGKSLHCYICFASADGKHEGSSVYLGLIEVAG